MTTSNALLDAQIGTDASGWHEISVDFAADEMQNFTETDWKELLARAPSMPDYWQERCAEAAGRLDGKSVFAVQLLVSLLEVGSAQTASIAASQLDDIAIQLPSRVRPKLLSLHEHLLKKESPRAKDVARLLEAISRV